MSPEVALIELLTKRDAEIERLQAIVAERTRLLGQTAKERDEYDDEIERLKTALDAGIRAAELALFVIRKQGVMPNSSWQGGFEKDLAAARAGRANEQTAPTSKCVAEHMGGGRCVGKCLDPKDCCGTPLEQNAVRKCTACDGTGTIEARDGGATCYACGGSGDQRDCYAHPRVPLSDASGNGSDG